MAFGFPSAQTLWRLARKVEDLFTTQARQGEALAAQQDLLDSLSKRMLLLETREEVIIVKAASSAQSAAAVVSTASTADISRRLGAMEERLRIGRSEPRQLPDQ